MTIKRICLTVALVCALAILLLKSAHAGGILDSGQSNPSGGASSLPTGTDVNCAGSASTCVDQGINNTPIVGTQSASSVLVASGVSGQSSQWNFAKFCTNPLTATGDLLLGVTSACPTNLADVAVGSVLKAGGVGANPSFGTITSNAVASSGAATFGTTNAATNYMSFGSAGATEAAQVWFPSKLSTISNVSCITGNVPGASNSYAIGLEECDNTGASCGAVGAPGAIAISIAGASTKVGQDLTNSYTQVANKTYAFKVVLTVGGSAPTASTIRCAFTQSVN